MPPPSLPPADFTFWVVLSLIWGYAASLVATFLPLIEARQTIGRILGNILCCRSLEPELHADKNTVSAHRHGC